MDKNDSKYDEVNQEYMRIKKQWKEVQYEQNNLRKQHIYETAALQ